MSDQIPLLREFSVPLNEVNEQLEVGQTGELSIPVEVVGVLGELVMFRKRNKARAAGKFTAPSLKDLEDDIGMAER